MNAWTKVSLLTTTLAFAGLSAGCSEDDGEDGGGEMTSGDGDMTGATTGEDGTTGTGGNASGGSTATGGEEGTGDGDATSGDGDGSTTSAGAGGNTSEVECSTILELAAATADLSSLVAAVEAAGLGGALEGDELTVFAPTNAAFDALLDGLGLDFASLTAEQLAPILTYHVADSVVDSTAATGVAMSEENTFKTLGGTIVLSEGEMETLMIDADEAAATVVMADIEACNGMVHIIDKVLLPSLTDIIVSQPSFSGLLGLVGASSTDPVNVAAALDGASSKGAWTLFAPNNDAVAGAPEGLTPEQITTALLYHAYDAEMAVPAAVAITLDATIQTAGGEELKVLGDAQDLSVTLTDGADNEVSVVTTDIYAANGIIHVIDGVLIPPSLAQ